ncbi:4-hydroxythreonine-4-phosphate dehydrogenase PdxA [Aurantimonas sp. Leaf443]|uniref:4-hydroxythreonine-4-phosphate dehydrogenase PdxA n=1 Tax=Aurantimonas sp. Leaf443 TaxID=1736378 RepID=UPI0006F7028C|nr:4-hydroxythreonine-4-phosphate dehydrogenase PdxA [Aurantimonas sp. Leaf443]KQT88400.1 4-hydroxythreonine-4-phosphate dehydrogenase [Aurantimonas sp. Leaf443]
MNATRPLAVTLGEPSGVGPELALMAYAARGAQTPVFACLADPDLLRARARRIGMELPIREIARVEDAPALFAEALPVLPLVNRQRETPARLDPVNAAGTIEAIDRATALALEGRAAGLVTGPIDKKALYDAGFRHPGHTEYLADLCSRRIGPSFRPVMLLFGPDLACVPVTIHVPLAEVAGLLTADLIVETCRITERFYRERLGLNAPRLAVAGLNPHAGERGAIGQEDERVVRPAVERLRADGIDATGPLPADTMFHRQARETFDVAICMYHDQALIPAKTLAFDETVNVTLGLPILRTSPDHGTAAGIAGTGTARPDSFIAALLLAGRMAAGEDAHRASDRQAARA